MGRCWYLIQSALSHRSKKESDPPITYRIILPHICQIIQQTSGMPKDAVLANHRPRLRTRSHGIIAPGNDPCVLYIVPQKVPGPKYSASTLIGSRPSVQIMATEPMNEDDIQCRWRVAVVTGREAIPNVWPSIRNQRGSSVHLVWCVLSSPSLSWRSLRARHRGSARWTFLALANEQGCEKEGKIVD